LAQVIKEETTLQTQAKKEWKYLGVIWSITLLTFFVPLLFKSFKFAPFIPLIAVALVIKFTWKSLIIIRGNKGERRVFNTLLQLPESYRVLNDVTIKVGDKEAQIDHVIISPFGAWCIETKSHLGRIYGKESDKNWTQKKKSEKGKIYSTSFYNPIAQNAVHCRRLREYLRETSGIDIVAKSVVVFTSADQLNIQSVTPVVTIKTLNQTIQSLDQTILLSEEEVNNIVKAVS